MNYSAIDTAYRCMRKFKLQYLDQLRVIGPENIDMCFGTSMHAALQACLEGDDAVGTFLACWDALQDKEFKQARFTWDTLRRAGIKLLERFERLHAKHFEIKHPMEERLFGELDGLKVEGTPDFIGLYKGIPSIVDFKTSGNPYPKEKIGINEQMYLYAHLAKQVHNFKATQLVYIVFVKSEVRIQVQRIAMSDEKLHSMLDNIHNMCKLMEGTQTFPMNRNSCIIGTNRCEFFSHCYRNQTEEETDGND